MMKRSGFWSHIENYETAWLFWNEIETLKKVKVHSRHIIFFSLKSVALLWPWPMTFIEVGREESQRAAKLRPLIFLDVSHATKIPTIFSEKEETLGITQPKWMENKIPWELEHFQRLHFILKVLLNPIPDLHPRCWIRNFPLLHRCSYLSVCLIITCWKKEGKNKQLMLEISHKVFTKNGMTRQN